MSTVIKVQGNLSLPIDITGNSTILYTVPANKRAKIFILDGNVINHYSRNAGSNYNIKLSFGNVFFQSTAEAGLTWSYSRFSVVDDYVLLKKDDVEIEKIHMRNFILCEGETISIENNYTFNSSINYNFMIIEEDN